LKLVILNTYILAENADCLYDIEAYVEVLTFPCMHSSAGCMNVKGYGKTPLMTLSG
jgi:hypothetical protein